MPTNDQISIDAGQQATASIGAGTTGSGTASAVTGTLDQMATYLTDGYWTDQGNTGAAWDTSKSNVITVNLTGLTPAGQQLARWALQAWEAVADLQFKEVSSGGEITFTDHDYGAYSYWSSTNGAITSATVNVHSSWITAGASVDSYAFSTYVHEIGHALGLGHQGLYDGNATYGVNNVFTNDSWQMSVMSYFDQIDNTAIQASYADVLTPMIVDVIAIQRLYGAPDAASQTSGNTVWGDNSNLGGYMGTFFNSLPGGAGTSVYNGGPVTFTIYDRDGIDTLNLTYTNVGGKIDMNGTGISDVGGLKGNLIIARGTVIENLITGAGNDTVTGNNADNFIRTGDGADTVYGNAGNDTILGGGWSDFLSGGDGNDYLRGDNGNDTLLGGDGDDVLGGRLHEDSIDGGAGNDAIWGGGWNDTLIGGTGNDTIGGGGDDDLIFGDAGFDDLRGGGGQDTIYGGGWSDTIDGSFGNDTLYGGAGTDLIFGGTHDDRIYGDAHNDTIWGGWGNDTLTGGTGADSFVFGASFDADVVTDFNMAEGDVLKFRSALWSGTHGALTEAQVIAEFAHIDAMGNVYFDFGNGNTVTLTGVTSTAGLAAGIDIF
ncbi:M10 family metallopeptidase [Tropicibacter sp. S64]|uniref:M10 family metallopeptidase n=1 Tax=Tropicibacter sp. S64 TaxID=3415122 RepID=UPI003C7E4E48